MFSLEKFGWDNCFIPADIRHLLSYLPKIGNLKILRSQHSYSGTLMYFPYRLFHDKDKKFMPGYVKEELINKGGYANIYKGKRGIFVPREIKNGETTLVKESSFQDICIKKIHVNITKEEDEQTPNSRHNTYIDELNAILYEAYIHVLIIYVFNEFKISSAVPNLYEVCAQTKNNTDIHNPEEITSVWLLMELINGVTLEKYLITNLKPYDYLSNDMIIIDILIQLAFFLKILQEKLYFNHRDMKINNLFVRYHEKEWSDIIHIPHFGEWKRSVDIVLIDFGFACIACGPDTPRPRSSLLSAGSWFHQEHDCLKYGRDIAQLIYSLNLHFPIQRYFTTNLCNFLHKSCTIHFNSNNINLLHGINEKGEPEKANKAIPCFNSGIYVFLAQNDMDVINCSPTIFLSGLRSLVGLK